MKYHQRHRQKREPEVGPQPTLNRADPPEDDLFAQSEQTRKNKNCERDRTENKSQRGPTGIDIARCVAAQGREPRANRQPPWVKDEDIQQTCAQRC